MLIFGVIAGPTPLVITVKWEDDRYAHLIQGASQRLSYHPAAVKRLVNARRASLRNAPISIRGSGLTRSDVAVYFDYQFQEFVFRGQLLISELQENVWFSQFSTRQRIAIERRRQTIARRNQHREEDERIDREQEAQNQLDEVRAGLVRGRPRGRRAIPADELAEREAQLAEDRRRYEQLRAEQEAAFQARLNGQPNSTGSNGNNGQHAGGQPPANQVNSPANSNQPVEQNNRADRLRALVTGERAIGQQLQHQATSTPSNNRNPNGEQSMDDADGSHLANNGAGDQSREMMANDTNGTNNAIHSLDISPNMHIEESSLAGQAAQARHHQDLSNVYSTPVTRRSERLSGSGTTGLTDLIRQLPFSS